jgi:hypothetical protein
VPGTSACQAGLLSSLIIKARSAQLKGVSQYTQMSQPPMEPAGG